MQLETLKNLYKNYFAKIRVGNEFNKINCIYVKFRPFLKTFLKNIKDKYEIFIYTHGTKEYATSIIQYINLNIEKDSLSTDRMMYRILDENEQPKLKSIKNVFPTQEKMILIIDDHIDVWKESGENFICIQPYKFFIERNMNEQYMNKKNNISKQCYIRHEYDNVLFCITNFLLSVHRKFFDFYSEYKIQKNIKRIAKDLSLKIFKGKTFYYHLNYYNFPICDLKKIKKGKENQNNKIIEKNIILLDKNMEKKEEKKENENNKCNENIIFYNKDFNEINIEEKNMEGKFLEVN